MSYLYVPKVNNNNNNNNNALVEQQQSSQSLPQQMNQQSPPQQQMNQQSSSQQQNIGASIQQPLQPPQQKRPPKPKTPKVPKDPQQQQLDGSNNNISGNNNNKPVRNKFPKESKDQQQQQDGSNKEVKEKPARIKKEKPAKSPASVSPLLSSSPASSNTTTTTTTSPPQQSTNKNDKPKKTKEHYKAKSSEFKYVAKEDKEKQEKEEKEKLEREKLEKERLEREEKERKEKEEQDRIEKERLEKEKKEKEEQEKKEKEQRIEQERVQRLRDELALQANLRTSNQKHSKSKQGTKDLDSNFKKVSTFAKKIKTITECREGIVNEVSQLNLSHYVSEIVPSLLKSNFKPQDTIYVVQVLSIMYQKYEDVDQLIQENIPQFFTPFSIPASDSESERNSKITKRRYIIRLMLDLFCVDIIHSYQPLFKLITRLSSVPVEQDKDQSYSNLLTFLNFLKQFQLILNYKDKIKDLNGTFLTLITEEELTNTKNIVTNYYQSLCNFLNKEKSALRDKEKEIKLFMRTKGEVPEDASSNYDQMRKQYEKLITNISNYAELIGEPVPNNDYSFQLEEEINNEQKTEQLEVFDSPFETEEQKQFYEITFTVPTISKDQQQTPKSTPLSPNSTNSSLSSAPTLSSISSPNDQQSSSENKDNTTTTTAAAAAAASNDSTTTPVKVAKSTEEIEKEKQKVKGIFEDLLKQLKNTNKPSVIDSVVQEFIKVPPKYTKPFLQQLLQQSRLDHIPTFTRFLSTIYQSSTYKGYVNEYIKEIEDDQKGLFEKKEQNLLTFKIRNIVYIGEFIKFGVLSRTTAFSYLRICFDDFTNHNIDIACYLFETCGRYLYRTPDSQIRLRNMLDILIKYRNATTLGSSKEPMVENAYLACRPIVVKKKEINPVKKFVKYLIFKHLSTATLDRIVEKLLQLPWPECESYLSKYLLDVQKGKFGNIYLIADILFHLKDYYPQFVQSVIWKLYEEITVGFEKNDFNQNQKRIMQVTLFGELYNACLLETNHVFDLLIGAIEYGYTTSHLFPASIFRERELLKSRPKPNLEEFDPVNDCFRIRFICTLLLVCKDCFPPEDIEQHLKPYLVFFQRYTLTKLLPLEIEFMISDVLQILPDLPVYKNWEDANNQCLILSNGGQIINNLSKQSESSSEKQESPPQQQPIKIQSKTKQQQQPQQQKNNSSPSIIIKQKDTTSPSIQTNTTPTTTSTTPLPPIENLNINQEELIKSEVTEFENEEDEINIEEDILKEFKAMITEGQEKKEKQRLALPSLFNITGGSNVNSDITSPITPVASNGFVPFKLLLKKGDKSISKNIEIPQDSEIVQNILIAKEEQEKDQRENKKQVLKQLGNL